MNAAETIAAAIEKLEGIKSDGTPGDWEILGNGDRFIAWHGDPASIGFEYIVAEPVEFENRADAESIVTLHRTIDAQLAILRHALARAESKIETGGNARSVWSHERDAENLARAILGDVS